MGSTQRNAATGTLDARRGAMSVVALGRFG
jgi:hypothetical protein